MEGVLLEGLARALGWAFQLDLLQKWLTHFSKAGIGHLEKNDFGHLEKTVSAI